MASTDEPLEANFLEARHNWNLEKLYTDLAAAKGKGLTPVEKKFLRGLLCGYSPAEIAAQVYQSGNSSAVRVYLSNGLYKYIQELLIQQGETGMPIKNWSRVTNLLEKAGYKLGFNQKLPLTDNVTEPSQNSIEVTQTVNNTVNKYQEWQEAIDIEAFYGRQEELTQLEQWIVKDNCRLIAIMGMGGIGKTSLAVKIAQQTQEHFELLIWRSLASAPPLEDLLEDLIRSFSEGQETNLPTTVEEKISRLMGCLRGSGGAATPAPRCLLVLDRVEAVLRPHYLAGSYREETQGYGELFRRLGEERHRSCCLLLSREQPRDITSLAGANLPVRTFQLEGLKIKEGVTLLQAKGMVGSEDEQQLLVRLYASNPLVLKIVAATIQDVFEGDITGFLAEGTIVCGDIRELLDQQFHRLSDLEKQVMYGLASDRRLVTLAEWPEELVAGVSKRERLEALESLRRRCLIDKVASTLIEKKSTSFTLQPAVRIYVAQKLNEQMAHEIGIQEIVLLRGSRLLGSLLNDELTRENKNVVSK
jgi:hypothetical protein